MRQGHETEGARPALPQGFQTGQVEFLDPLGSLLRRQAILGGGTDLHLEPVVDQEPQKNEQQEKEEKEKEEEIDWEEILLDGFDAGGRRAEYEDKEYFEPITVDQPAPAMPISGNPARPKIMTSANTTLTAVPTASMPSTVHV